MMFTNKELAFILYNNRSVQGVIKNFLPKDIDQIKLIDIENKLSWSKSFYQSYQSFVEVEKYRFDLSADDIIVTPDDIASLSDIILESHLYLSGKELEYLTNRGITTDIIKKYKIGGLSNITKYSDLVLINATCHPVLKNILEDGLEGGGIIIPLYNNGKLVNCAIRKISDIGKLKYSLTCPDISVWGIDDVESDDDIWICEGLFDMMALRSEGFKSVSISGAMWSGIQLYSLIKKSPKTINILCDSDRVGLKTGAILSKFFNISGIDNRTYICKSGKDASEVIFEKKIGISDIYPVKITNEMIEKQDESFNFLKYLENRKF